MSFNYYAICVIESVRNLGLKIVGEEKKYRLRYPENITKEEFKKKLIEMVKALEKFDQNVGTNEEYSLQYKVVDDVFYIHKIDNSMIQYNENFPVIKKTLILNKEIKSHIENNYDLNMVFEDGGEDHNLDDSIDAIMDKLEFAATKVGWTPKIRILAAALRNAELKRMALDKEIDEEFLLEWKNILKLSVDYIFESNTPKNKRNLRYNSELENNHEAKYQPKDDF